MRLAVSGRLGSAAGTPCRGSLTATIKRGTRAVATLRMGVARDCRFARTTVLARSRVGNARQLRVALRAPGAARSYRVAVG